jgi:hypothetical protein
VGESGPEACTWDRRKSLPGFVRKRARLDEGKSQVTFVSVEVQATAPAVAESVEQPMASDLLGDVGVTGRNARPWPHVSTLLSASAEPTTAKAVARLAWDIVDEWGDQSFPASDPPANW